jgi:hypothetical protein
MFENNLHVWTRLQQNFKLVKAGQLATQSDVTHEEHVCGGLVLYERMQNVLFYAWGVHSHEVNAIGPSIVPAIS